MGNQVKKIMIMDTQITWFYYNNKLVSYLSGLRLRSYVERENPSDHGQTGEHEKQMDLVKLRIGFVSREGLIDRK